MIDEACLETAERVLSQLTVTTVTGKRPLDDEGRLLGTITQQIHDINPINTHAHNWIQLVSIDGENRIQA